MVAISSQTPDHSLSTVEKNACVPGALGYRQHSGSRLRVAFDLEDEVQRLSVDFFGNDLTRDDGGDDVSGWTLPLPTT